MRFAATDLTAGRQTGNVIRAAIFAAFVLAIAVLVFHFSHTVQASRTAGVNPFDFSPSAVGADARKAPPAKTFSLPLFFEPNQGQTDPRVKFLARGAGYGLFLTGDEAVLELQHVAPSAQPSGVRGRSRQVTNSLIRMRLDGANASARVSGASPLPGKSNYFIGNDAAKWRLNIPQFARVEYAAVYPGVDLVYYGDQGRLEYDFRVSPGADPRQIALRFAGASLHIDSGKSGDLILATEQGEVRFHAPRIYQPAAASGNAAAKPEKAVAGSFRQLAGNRIGFAIGEYDHSRELVIDPTLAYSTYVGGAGTELLTQVAVDQGGKIYVAGSTTSAYFFQPHRARSSRLSPARRIFSLPCSTRRRHSNCSMRLIWAGREQTAWPE